MNNSKLSYWDREFLNYDYMVIGCGIVGLSTAISLKESNKSLSVCIFERDILPTGASTKNAGFACIGSLTEILDDVKSMGEEASVQLVKTRFEGLQLLRSRLGDENIGYKDNGSFEVISQNELSALDSLDKVNNLLKPVFQGKDAFTRYSEKEIENFGFNREYVKAIVRNNFEGEINTGKMMKSLISLANRLGVHIIYNCKVETFNDLDKGVELFIHNQTLNEKVRFTCKKLAICTNAFTPDLIPGIDVIPGRGQVIITEPIPNLPFKGIYHFDEGYYYFREIDGRILFGGGRNLDFKGEAQSTFQYNDKIINQLETYLNQFILPSHKGQIKIDQKWTGIMAFGKDKKPIIQNHSKNVVLGVRMGGMGVAIGSLVGKKVSTLLLLNNNSNL